jgi:hypothetical protein
VDASRTSQSRAKIPISTAVPPPFILLPQTRCAPSADPPLSVVMKVDGHNSMKRVAQTLARGKAVDEPAMEKAVPSGGHENVAICAAAGDVVNTNQIAA